MAEIRKVQCDRCKVEVDLRESGGGDWDRPDGWEYLENRDLCPQCHDAYKTQMKQAKELFFRNEESPVVKLIRAGRAMTAGTDANGWGKFRDALDEIDPPPPVF